MLAKDAPLHGLYLKGLYGNSTLLFCFVYLFVVGTKQQQFSTKVRQDRNIFTPRTYVAFSRQMKIWQFPLFMRRVILPQLHEALAGRIKLH